MVKFLKDLTKGYTGKLNKRPRRMADRSNLAIEFPQAKGRVIRTYIPFLENPSISEKGKANLNTYNLTGRAGQLFSYGGADSRSISVTFQITLVHLLEMQEELGEKFKQLFKAFFSEEAFAAEAFKLASEREEEAEQASRDNSFFDPNIRSSSEADAAAYAAGTEALFESLNESLTDDLNVTEGKDRDHANIHRNYYRQMIETLTGSEIALQDSNNQVLGAINSIKSAFGIDVVSRAQLIDEVNKTIDLFIFYINLIRGSVLNNSRNTIYGPPIIRLNHGTMYNNVPCLLQDYTINIIDDAGYDVETVTPKRVSISLNLVESRAGNFGNYVVGDIFNGDNLTGWESVIENNTIDPYNGLVGATAPDIINKRGVKFK